MSFGNLLKKVNVIGRIGALEKSNAVQAATARPYGALTGFKSKQKLPVPYYSQLRYLAKRNTSLRTIIHVIQDKVLERDPEFIPRFASKCMECGKEYQNETETCTCGGMTRPPDQTQLEHIKEVFDDCNDNDQSFKAVLHECEDNLNILDDAFLLILKEYSFDANNNLKYARVKEILSADPEWFKFDLDDKMRQGVKHWTCVEHRTLHDAPGVCEECGKPLSPVWYIYDEGSAPMPYLKDEIIHWSRYSPSKTFGYPPVATVFEEAMIELNGNILLNDTYREQRPPKGILAIVTKNLTSLQKFWQKEMEQVRINPNHMPVMGIESDSGRGSATYTALLNSVADMDVLNVSEKMRDGISGLYRITPLYHGGMEGVGGLNAEDVQRAVTAEPISSAQQGYHEEVFPKLLDMFGITDWDMEFPSPYPADDNAELDKRTKETQIATMMHGMGFQVSLNDEDGSFIYSGESQAPQPDMGGLGSDSDSGGGSDGGGDSSSDGNGRYQDELLLEKELQKSKTYVKDPSQVPKGAKVQRGPKGGLFYEDRERPEKPDVNTEAKKRIKAKGAAITENLSDKAFYHLTDSTDFKPSAEFEQGVQEFGSGLYLTEKSNIGFWDHQMQGREFAIPIDISKLKIVKEDNLPPMSEMSKDLKELGYTGKDISKLEPKVGTINRNPFEIAVKRTWAKEAGFQGIIPKTHGDYSTEQLVIFDLKDVGVGKPESTQKLRLKEKLYTSRKKSDDDLWKILGRPLEKARKYITDPSKAPKGAKVQRGKMGGYFYDAAPVRTSLKVQPEEVKNAVKDLYAKGYDAKMIASELQDKHGVKVHPETVNRFLEHEGVGVRPKRNTVSHKDVEAQQKTITEQAKQIDDLSGKMDALQNENAATKAKVSELAQTSQKQEAKAKYLERMMRNYAPDDVIKRMDKDLADIEQGKPSAPETKPKGAQEPPKTENSAAKPEPDSNSETDTKHILNAVVNFYESTIKSQKFESAGAFGDDGTIILQKDGGKDRIDFTNEERLKCKGSTFTHNHPRGSPGFSPEDIRFACQSEMKEMRVVTPSGNAHQMRLKDGGNFSKKLWDDKISHSYISINRFVRHDFNKKIEGGEMTIAEANNQHWNEVWKRVAEDVPELEYIGD